LGRSKLGQTIAAVNEMPNVFLVNAVAATGTGSPLPMITDKSPCPDKEICQ